MHAELQEIYEAEPGDEPLTPLVLIHDGGGTIFQYYMLNYVGRRTFGIANPYFESGRHPEDGILGLARQYVKAVQHTVGKGPVILGGMDA